MLRKPSVGACIRFVLYSLLSSSPSLVSRARAACALVTDASRRSSTTAAASRQRRCRWGARAPRRRDRHYLVHPPDRNRRFSSGSSSTDRPFASPLMASSPTTPASESRSGGGDRRPSDAAPLPLPKLSSKIARTLDPCVVLMKSMVREYSDLWKDRGGIHALSQGVVYWSPPAEALDRMVAELSDPDNSLHQYGPDEGLLELRQALEVKLADDNRLTDHDVMVTVGANQAYANCVLTLLGDRWDRARERTQQPGPGTESPIPRAVVFAPYYFNHVMAIQMCSPESLLVGPCSDAGVPDVDWLEGQFRTSQDPIQMVTIVNPGNPTGVTLDRSVLQRVVDLCRANACWLVLDCTYENFVHDPTATSDSSSSANEEPCFDGSFDGEPHVIHIFSFSKSYALAGYRCGYLALSRSAPGLYEQMLKVQDTVPIAPSRISQMAALGALSAGRAWVAERFATLDVGRQAILRALGPLKVMGGTGAMYVMAQLPANCPVSDQDVARTLVRDHGVAVIPGSFCGFPGWIRVCYSNLPPDLCVQAGQRLSQGIQSLIKDTET